MILQATQSKLKILTIIIDQIMISYLKKIKTTLIPLLLVSNISFGQEYDYAIIKIIDGDTIEFAADFLPKPLKPTLYLRLNGIDTPETHAPKCQEEKLLGENAKKYTAEILANSKIRKIIISDWDKYGGRIIGDVITEHGKLSSLLINNNYAHLYDGTKKQSWCPNNN